MRILITGVSGLLGWNAARQLVGRHEVTGCFWRHPVHLEGARIIPCDLREPAEAQAIIRETRPELILHTAGLTDVDECERHPDLAHALNVTITAHVAQAARQCGARLVHLSTDHLFEGRQGWADETHPPAPINVYAETKREAEQIVQAVTPEAVIVRTNFYGWGPSHRASLSDWILMGLRQGQERTMFTDVFITPILINDLVDLLLELVQRGIRGVIHAAGSERVSKHDFAIQLAQVFGCVAGQIRPISVDAFPFTAKRPKDMSLSTAKVSRLLGRPMPTVIEGLTRLKRLEEKGWTIQMSHAC